MSEEFRRRFKVWRKWSKRNTNSWLHKILVLFGVVHSPTFGLAMSMERCRESMRVAEAAIKGLTDGIACNLRIKMSSLGPDDLDETDMNGTVEIIQCMECGIAAMTHVNYNPLDNGWVQTVDGYLCPECNDKAAKEFDKIVYGDDYCFVTDDLDNEYDRCMGHILFGSVTDDLNEWAKGTPLEVQDDE